jgi:hypothetical protein
MSRLSKILVLLTAMATLGFLAQAASATSGAHFFFANSSVNDGGGLVVSFDEAGVGQQQVNYTLTADASATYACLNGGGNHPKASNKESVQGSVSGGATFTPQNGRVTGSLTTGPLTDPSFTCPSGQTRVLACVSYSNIVLTDTTNHVTANPADVSRTFFNIGAPC